MRGDCSIRIEGYGFSAEEIAACAARQGILSLELELSSTSECTCVNCRDAGGPPRQVLTADEIRELIGQAKSLGCRQVILVDGETEQYPHLEEIVDHLHSEGLRIELFANEVMTPALASFLHGHNVSMSVPVDALAGIDGLPALSALREAGYGEPGNPALAIRISAGEENLDEIPGIWRWARVRGIDPHVQIITPRNGVEHQLKLVSPNPARAMFEELGRIDREEFDRTWTTPPSLIGRSCKRHLYACHVTACGTVFACVGVTIPLGNIRTEPLRDILVLSEVLENLRGFGDKVKEPCRTCSKSTDCYGCRGAAYQMTGDYLAGDSMCWKAADAPVELMPADASKYIPHGPSIRMIDRLTQIGERTSRVEFTIPPNSLWTDETGVLDEVAYVEMIAQSFAATHGFHRWAHETADQQGLLLGIKDLQITGQARVGQKLIIHLRKVARFGDFGLVEGDIRHEDGSLVATGQIKVWRPNEEMEKAIVS